MDRLMKQMLAKKEYEGPMITVCDKCLQASCWQGIFMCWDSGNAGTVDLPMGLLEELKFENKSYWENDIKTKQGVKNERKI